MPLLLKLAFVVLIAATLMPLSRLLTVRLPSRLFSGIQPRQARTMHIQSIPMWRGSGNNYAYIVTDAASSEAVVIDPANPPEVLPALAARAEAGDMKLGRIINTHHHHDHAGGNGEILKHFKLPVVAGKDSEHVSETPAHNSSFKVGDAITVTALHTPCHTQDSICYFFEDAKTNKRAVFTGDTLFIGGCGRFFEGTPEQMDAALNKVLAALPDDTAVYPGHEYTAGNVKFAQTVSKADAVQKLADFAAANRETQGKFTIGDEKRHNVFMRLDDTEIQKATGQMERVEVMRRLREMKNAM